MEVFIEQDSVRLSTDFRKSDSGRYTLFLYGGSKVNGKGRFNVWQNELERQGIGSLSFDFSGMGGSSGEFTQSSLSKRIAESKAAIQWLLTQDPSARVNLYGTSMGGYLALGLVQEMPNVFQKLILQAPAAFSKTSHGLNFDGTFSNEIRKSESWKSSLTFDWLKQYTGKVLMIVSENDSVIPLEIIQAYKNILEGKSGSKVVILKNAPHGIWSNSKEDHEFREQVFKEIIGFT